MTKVLLVEDDNNLREIFEMRLASEGYKTVSAGDGEEALVVAIKEKPDLVIADVMMPKLSGFEMVENMRAAPELANVKVIMMTALGQAEDRARGEKLGVVKYLVKSQVTLEDFISVVREVLPPDQNSSSQGTNINNQESEQTMQDDSTSTNPPTDTGTPPSDNTGAVGNPIASAPTSDAVTNDAVTAAQEQTTVANQINNFANDPNAGTGFGDTPTPDAPAPTTPEPTDGNDPAPVVDNPNPAPTEPNNGTPLPSSDPVPSNDTPAAPVQDDNANPQPPSTL